MASRLILNLLHLTQDKYLISEILEPFLPIPVTSSVINYFPDTSWITINVMKEHVRRNTMYSHIKHMAQTLEIYIDTPVSSRQSLRNKVQNMMEDWIFECLESNHFPFDCQFPQSVKMLAQYKTFIIALIKVIPKTQNISYGVDLSGLDRFNPIVDPDLATIDKDILLTLVERDGRWLPFYTTDRDIIVAAITQNGEALSTVTQYDPDLAGNRELRLLAAQGPNGWIHRGEDDKEIVLMRVQNDGLALKSASYFCQDDANIALAAIQDIPTALAFASPRLRDDRNFVSKAIQVNSIALLCASPRLKNDKLLVMKAIPHTLRKKSIYEAFILGSEPFWKLDHYRLIEGQISEVLLDDKEVMLLAMHFRNRLSLVSERLRNDKDVVAPAVTWKGAQLKDASKPLQDDDDIVRLAIDNDPTALQFASPRLQALFRTAVPKRKRKHL
jgi:hypothetical protein